MLKEELKKLKIGDIVIISGRTNTNHGKRGIVTEIGPIGEGRGATGIFVKPLDCEFEVGKGHILNEKEIESGTYIYRYSSLRLEKSRNNQNRKGKSQMANTVIQTNAYLYQIQKGILNMYEGDVDVAWKPYEGVFKTKTKNRMCSSQPKLVVNAAVWLPERNDDLARELLIQYEEEEISILEKKIENHRIKIKVLKGEI